jgi:hypothetical protein
MLNLFSLSKESRIGNGIRYHLEAVGHFEYGKDEGYWDG